MSIPAHTYQTGFLAPSSRIRTWLLGLLLCSTPVLAQDLQYLIFEPVPIKFAAGEGDDAPLVEELLSLPAENPVDLYSWLVARRNQEQAPAPEAIAMDIARYERAVADLELLGGPYEPRLSQELLSLSNLYLQSGDFLTSLQLLERASHVNRVNEGLFNLSQIPIIEKTIEAHLARGDLLAADEQHEYLFYLQRKSLGEQSIDLLPALTRYAEWNVFAFTARPRLLPPPVIDEESGDAVPAQQIAPLTDLESFRTQRLINAQNIYQSIIQILVSNYGLSDPRLLDFEKQLALTNYFFATTFDISSVQPVPSSNLLYSNTLVPYDMGGVASNSLGYRQGKEALERRISYLQAMEGVPAQELATAWVDLGDWLLRFKKRSGALEAYQEAYAGLQEAGISQAEIDAMFLPPLPTQVPTFLAHGYTRAIFDMPADLALQYKGHIDIEFSLNRFGAPGDIRVLGKSETASEAIESRLVRSLRRNYYRPRYDAGQVRENDLVQLRYYFTY